MAGTIDLPVIGTVPRTAAYLGGGGAVLIIGYAWWRYKQTGVAPGEIVEGVGDGVITDPTDGAGNVPGQTGNSNGNFNNVDPAIIDTNAEWVMDAQEKLGAVGYEGQLVLNTLGKFLARQGLTASEIILVTAARAAAGEPPVGGPYTVIAGPPVPATGGTKGNQETHLVVMPGWKVDQWILDVQKQYRPDFSWPIMKALNPGVEKNVASNKAGSADNSFIRPQVIRIR